MDCDSDRRAWLREGNDLSNSRGECVPDSSPRVHGEPTGQHLGRSPGVGGQLEVLQLTEQGWVMPERMEAGAIQGALGRMLGGR